MMTEPTTPDALTPAATVVVVRDGPSGLEVLMLKRSTKGAFGGHWVFPGGKVDAVDHHVDDQDPLPSFRRAAVREAAEEAAIDLHAVDLITLAYWEPPLSQPKRFATWFFLAPATPADVIVDGHEIHDHDWVTPADMLARRDRGEVELAAPTWMTLYQIGGHPDVATLLATESARPTPEFRTHMVIADDERITLWAGDAGYDTTDPLVAGARHRLVMRPTGWFYEGTLTPST